MLCSFAKLESLHCHVAHAFVRLQTQHFVCCMQEGHAVYYLTWIPGPHELLKIPMFTCLLGAARDQVSHGAAHKEEVAPSTTHVAV